MAMAVSVAMLGMSKMNENLVSIEAGQKRGDPSIVTINCLDKLGLAADITRIIFEFGLRILRSDLATDGKWCFGMLWVGQRPNSTRSIKWASLKKRLISSCPSNRSSLYSTFMPQLLKQSDFYVLHIYSSDWCGLLHDFALKLWELELNIVKIKATTSPDGNTINTFYLTDMRETIQREERQKEVHNCLKGLPGVHAAKCEIQLARQEWDRLESILPASNLNPSLAEDLIINGSTGMDSETKGSTLDITPNLVSTSITIDNALSPNHTLVQISCKDRVSLLYDCTRVLKDRHLRLAYARLSATPENNKKGTVDLDLFISEEDGKKIMDPRVLKTLCSCLEAEIVSPIRVMVSSKGPDTQLLVAVPIESGGHIWPRVLLDSTHALKILKISIFKADTGRITIGEQQWEVCQFLLTDTPGLPLTSTSMRRLIVDQVKYALMG